MSSTPIYDELAATYLVDGEPTGHERPGPEAERPDGAPPAHPSAEAPPRERTKA
ncbi:hypothetical protein ABZ816_32315 [Actinosynnema sp. NPDC047251]|uniref:Uncharacterized protein n=1 Tax=Saccharothrix espanaensis (strain ATCC 51144 / DSM 44229 / JCM 9112 / NBRC 15066 / NRRL 15764) TaxID=1179773 RepID=K0JWZ8_SACES|nr:hypothetical protein [Saccharothrix espanaensis]CCH29932.1 hypothetical protein BN6_26190 [Saccharothrix espanaensis DSM 44229]